MNKKTLRKCSLFSGLDDAALASCLELLDAREQNYIKGSVISSVAVPMHRFGLVLEGNIQVLRDDRDGHHMIMAHVAAGDTFGESLSYLGRPSPVYIQAVTDCRVLWLSTARLANPAALADPATAALACRFTAMLASRALNMNDRIQLLSQLTIRDKINTLLHEHAHRCRSNSFTLPMSREDMAFYLGVNRSALSRELGNMRRDGLIDFDGNSFTLLSHEWEEAEEHLN